MSAARATAMLAVLLCALPAACRWASASGTSPGAILLAANVAAALLADLPARRLATSDLAAAVLPLLAAAVPTLALVQAASPFLDPAPPHVGAGPTAASLQDLWVVAFASAASLSLFRWCGARADRGAPDH